MYILHLQNVPDSADETIIRRYFKDLKISDGGVEIVGGINGDVLINFDDEADILQALTFGQTPIHGCRIKILLAEQADKEKIIAKALKPPKSSSKRSKSLKGSNVPDSSISHTAPPWQTKMAALGNHPDAEYAAPALASSPEANDGLTAAERSWSAELKTKLLDATTQRPQLASDIVRNALLKMNEGRSPTPTNAPYTQPQTSRSFADSPNSTQYAGHHLHGSAEFNTMPPLSSTAQWASQAPPPPSSIPDLTAKMLKNILRSTNAVPLPSPVGAPYNQPVPAPQLSWPRMPPGQQWSTQVIHPRGPLAVHAPNQWPVLPDTSLPPPGLIHAPFRQRVPAPTLRPSMFTSSKVVPSPRPVAVPVPTTLPLAVPPTTAQALGSAQKRSRWGGMAVGSSLPPPTTQIVSSSILPKITSTLPPPGTISSAKPIQGNKAQNSAKVLGNTAMIMKQKSSATPQVISRNVALKRERTPAQAAKIQASNNNAAAIVIIDSDSDSESEVKQKKRKIGNVSAIKTVKSDSGRDKIQKVYRSKRSRSRSKSRGRSRSRSRGRDRSRSRGRDRSRSRGRNRSRSRGRDRSRDRGREQWQKPRNYDQDRTRKPGPVDARTRKPGPLDARTRKPGPGDARTRKPYPADAEPKVASLLELSATKPVSLEMFKNDPNSVTVHNVAETVTIMVFRDFFYGHPIVRDGIVLTPSDNIPNCQTGYIKFVHERDVEEVKQLSFTTLDGRKLLIKSCCEKENVPAVKTVEVVSKVEAESEGHSEPHTRHVIGHRETVSKPLKVLKIPAPKESPFSLLGVSEHITSYHVGIRAFKPGTTACEMWSWFGGPDGHVKGIIVSHRIRKDDDELAYVMYGSKALRNTFRCPKDVQLVWHRYSEKAVIHKLIGSDVCYLTETTLLGQDREISKAEIKQLRKFRPEGPTKPPLQQQEEDVPQTESSKPGQTVPQEQTQHCSLAPWKKLSYICLHETPKGISASNVWSLYGGKKGRAEGVILANCKSKNELKGHRFNIAFVGFRDPYVVQQEIDKRCSGQRYSSDGTMRFLARLPDSGMIFQSSTSGQDRVLPKHERLQLRGEYLTQEEIEKSKSEDAQTLPPSWKEFELSEEFGKGLFFLQIKEPELKALTASKAWSWYPPETCMTRGAVVLKNPDGTPAFAYVAFSDNLARNKAFASFSSTAGTAWKASWTFTVRRFAMYFAEKGQDVFIATKSGVDRSVTEKEKAYCMRMLQTGAWNTNMISRALITDPVEYAKEVERDAAIGAAAAADKSDELFYLILKRVPPKVTACEVWNWFSGSTGNSKSAVVVYDPNGIAASAYVGFEREIDRDNERPKQKFSKVCTYRGRGVRLLSLMPGCKATESTTTGVDRVLTEHDLGVVRWKLRKIDGIGKGETSEEDRESTSSDHTQVEEKYKELPWTCGKSKTTVNSNNQSACVQVQGKQQPQHSSSQEKDTFKTPSSVPQGKRMKTETPNEQSTWVQGKQQPQPQHSSLQGKGVKTITPYEQSPWVQVERKPQVLPQPEHSSLEPWQKLSYLCLYETPKGNTASQVWSWFGAEKEQVQCVILGHCTSQNELQDGRFHVAFVGFKEPCILKKELDRLGRSKWYSPDEAMRFLARLPHDCPIFRALTFGHDRLLSKKVRTDLQENYLTEEERVEKQHSELKPNEILTSTPNPEDFTLSEENVRGMLFVQHRVLPKTCTACKVWAWHQLDSGKSKGVVLLKEVDGTPHSAFVAYEDAKARAEALAKGQFTSKASWSCVVRRVSVLASRGFQVLMSTTLGKDRAPTEAEKEYMLHIHRTNTTPVSSDPMITDTEPTNVLSTAAAIAIAASGQHTKAPKKEIDIAAAAAADNSDELFYLRIRKLPEKVTACQVWSWFQGSSGNSKSAVVVCGANNVTVCAYVGFEKEMHRDMGVTNQRFSKACTYHSRSVFLVDLNPSFKVTESTVTGVDRDLTVDDFAVIRYKLQQNAVEKKKPKDGNTNSGPSCQQQPTQNTQLASMQASNSNGQSNLIERHPSYSTQYQAQQSGSTQNHLPQINIHTPVYQPKKDIDKPVHQPQMDIDKPVQQPQMEIDKPVHQAQMEIDKPLQTAQMDIQQLLESVQNLYEAENTIYFRLVKLRPNITAGEIWSWFRGSRGPTRCATLVREFDGTALFAYVGFVSDHTSYLENLELGTFSLCGPKAKNIELASLHPSAQIIQSTKHGDKPVLPETLSLFRAGILGGAKADTGT